MSLLPGASLEYLFPLIWIFFNFLYNYFSIEFFILISLREKKNEHATSLISCQVDFWPSHAFYSMVQSTQWIWFCVQAPKKTQTMIRSIQIYFAVKLKLNAVSFLFDKFPPENYTLEAWKKPTYYWQKRTWNKCSLFLVS
jgi:hypothetical protein